MAKKLRAVKGNNQVDFSERKNQAECRDRVIAKEEKMAQSNEIAKLAQQRGK